MRPALPPEAVVKVRHRRRVASAPEVLATRFEIQERFPVDGRAMLPTGGETEVTVELPDGRQAEGRARCSEHDNYSRRIGRDIALGRAAKRLGL